MLSVIDVFYLLLMSSTATRLAPLAFNSALTASSILFLSLAVNKLKPGAQKHVLSFQLYK